MNPTDEHHFFNSTSIWPNLQIIKTEAKYWNIDESIVDVKEYSLGNIIIKKYIPLIHNPKGYGPTLTSNLLTKFLEDFENEVNLRLKEKGYNEKFRIYDDNENGEGETPYIDGLGDCGEFYARIYPIVSYKLARGVSKLEWPITKFFSDERHKNSLELAVLFSNSYKEIFKIWKYYSLV